MIRAAIYARFSSDLQRDKSIDDQIALCREVAARDGATVVLIFEDRAISGASTMNRPGFRDMMRAAEQRGFDVLIAEDIDRISRDQSDYHAARKRLDFLDIAIHTATGKITKMDGALRALMGEMFLENLALHTRRGLEGVIRDGRHAGGRAYGYRAKPGCAGELEIVEDEAEIVRRIFAEYLAGANARTIAARLNADHIAPPRGTAWNASTINGNTARGGGILLNEIYSGRIVWNKVRMIKDPATGKRISRPNPKEQHRTAEAEHLRIIDAETWNAAQERKQERRKLFFHKARSPARMLSGLLKCGSCGGAMSSVGADKGGVRVQCSAFREAGTCKNGRRVHIDEIERRVLDSLRTNLDNPVLIAEFAATYNAERKRLAQTKDARREKIEKRQSEITREITRAIDAIVKTNIEPASLTSRIKELESERETLAIEIAAIGEPVNVITLHPAALSQYRNSVETLAALLKNNQPGDRPGETANLFESLHGLIERVIVSAPPGIRRFEIEIEGRLAALMAAPLFPSRSDGGGLVVAREGLEPPTPGL